MVESGVELRLVLLVLAFHEDAAEALFPCSLRGIPGLVEGDAGGLGTEIDAGILH